MRPRFTRPPRFQEGLAEALFTVAPPVLIALGTVGNLLSFMIMRSKEFSSTPSSFIYSVLAVTDTAVLYTGLLRYWMLETWDYDPRLDSNAACSIHLYVTYLLGHLSACYLMILTIERVISVYFPMHCRTLCSKRRMVMAVVIATLVEMTINVHFLIYYRLVATWRGWMFCTNLNTAFDEPWRWIDSSLASYVPFAVIFVGNVMIVMKLYLSHRAKKKMTQQSSVKGTSSTTAVLIVVCSCFLVLTVPSTIYFVGSPRNLWHYRYDNFIYRLSMILYYLNNTINFLLYFLSGARFRKAFVKMFFTRCSADTDSASARSMSNLTASEAV
jgi:hypothetical protein